MTEEIAVEKVFENNTTQNIKVYNARSKLL